MTMMSDNIEVFFGIYGVLSFTKDLINGIKSFFRKKMKPVSVQDSSETQTELSETKELSKESNFDESDPDYIPKSDLRMKLRKRKR